MRRAVLFTVLLTGFLANLCRHGAGPVGFHRSSDGTHLLVQLCTSVRVLNHPLFVTHVHCLLFRKKGVSQGSDGRQISLICLPALRADGGQISLICLLTNMFTALSRSV